LTGLVLKTDLNKYLKISDFDWVFLCTFTYVALLCRTVY